MPDRHPPGGATDDRRQGGKSPSVSCASCWAGSTCGPSWTSSSVSGWQHPLNAPGCRVRRRLVAICPESKARSPGCSPRCPAVVVDPDRALRRRADHLPRAKSVAGATATGGRGGQGQGGGRVGREVHRRQRRARGPAAGRTGRSSGDGRRGRSIVPQRRSSTLITSAPGPRLPFDAGH